MSTADWAMVGCCVFAWVAVLLVMFVWFSTWWADDGDE